MIEDLVDLCFDCVKTGVVFRFSGHLAEDHLINTLDRDFSLSRDRETGLLQLGKNLGTASFVLSQWVCHTNLLHCPARPLTMTGWLAIRRHRWDPCHPTWVSSWDFTKPNPLLRARDGIPASGQGWRWDNKTGTVPTGTSEKHSGLR